MVANKYGSMTGCAAGSTCDEDVAGLQVGTFASYVFPV